MDLIEALTKAEKRHFMLYARRNATKSDALFIKLFEQLSRRKRFDEEAILKAVPEIRKSQIPNLRSKLYREILRALRLLRSQSKAEIEIHEYIDYAYVLYDKGLYRQSLSVLERAKAKAKETKQQALILEIVAFEKQIESQHITRSIDGRAEELSDEAICLAESLLDEVAYSNLSLKLYGLYLKMGHARNKAEEKQVKEYFRTNLPSASEQHLNFTQKLYLYQSYVWLYQITQEFAKQYRYAVKWVDLFHDNPEMIPANIPMYLKGLHNVMNAQYLTFQYDRFTASLQELILFNSSGKYTLTKNEESLRVLFIYIHKLNDHFLKGTFADGVTWVHELERIIDEDPYNWDIHRRMVFNYKIACIYFGAGDNEQAITRLNKINNTFNPNLREDIQGFARILSLIAHFELGNDILVSYQLKSVYRFLLKMKELNATHAEILNFVKRTPRMLPSDVHNEFIALRKRLLKVQKSRFENRSSLYLDIISWLESKIESRPVQDIIAEKYRKRLAYSPR